MTAEDGDARPLYTIQAYFDGKLTVEDFARTGEDRPTTPHDVFDETLPVVDVAAIKDGSEEQRQANIALMLQAAKSWGFFRIANHGVPLQVVLKDGKWVGIQPDDSTFVVNIGDTFMALTNSILHSAAHRAVVNAKEDRYSIVYFYGIDKSITLTVPPELTLTIALSSTGFSQS